MPILTCGCKVKGCRDNVARGLRRCGEAMKAAQSGRRLGNPRRRTYASPMPAVTAAQLSASLPVRGSPADRGASSPGWTRATSSDSIGSDCAPPGGAGVALPARAAVLQMERLPDGRACLHRPGLRSSRSVFPDHREFSPPWDSTSGPATSSRGARPRPAGAAVPGAAPEADHRPLHRHGRGSGLERGLGTHAGSRVLARCSAVWSAEGTRRSSPGER